jgi:D-glycero-D-manno-heptose 1,7-bisphosphate phosphatase
VEAGVIRRFVLLDRDGTINEEVGHLSSNDELRPIPGSIEAMRRLRSLGLGIAIVTNQADVGRGLLAPERLDEIHAYLRGVLSDGGVEVDGIYVCPHRPEDGCGCRKPRPGLAERAAADLGFELGRAFVVGDHAADVGLARAIGATGILVRTGHGEEELAAGGGRDADAVVADLAEAVDLIEGRVLSGAGR